MNPIEKYATIGLCGGSGGCVLAAALHASPLLVPIVVGGAVGALTGAAYGIARLARARRAGGR